MTGKQQRDVERRIDDYFYFVERLLVRTLLFACFVHEAGRFVWSLLR